MCQKALSVYGQRIYENIRQNMIIGKKEVIPSDWLKSTTEAYYWLFKPPLRKIFLSLINFYD